MIRVTEIFHSIQGESTHAGRPCTFIRLAGCNLRCVWCDSEYTFTGGETMGIDEILREIASHGCNLIEVTGGEPLAQREALELLTRLCDEGYEVLLETSGSIDIEPVDRRVRIIMDIKCPGSGEMETNRLENLAHLENGDEIKLVILDRADFDWAKDMIEQHRLDRWTVLFSPVWNQLELRDLAEWMLEARVPARLQTQLHKHVWGEVPGR